MAAISTESGNDGDSTIFHGTWPRTSSHGADAFPQASFGAPVAFSWAFRAREHVPMFGMRTTFFDFADSSGGDAGGTRSHSASSTQALNYRTVSQEKAEPVPSLGRTISSCAGEPLPPMLSPLPPMLRSARAAAPDATNSRGQGQSQLSGLPLRRCCGREQKPRTRSLGPTAHNAGCTSCHSHPMLAPLMPLPPCCSPQRSPKRLSRSPLSPMLRTPNHRHHALSTPLPPDAADARRRPRLAL